MAAARYLRSLATVASRASTRGFAAKAAPAAEEDIVSGIFKQQQQKFRALLAETDKLQVPLSGAPEEVKTYVAAMDKIKAKIGIPSVKQRIESALKFTFTTAPDMRSFLAAESALREKMGVTDSLGTAELFSKALDKVEKEIGKPLLKSDKKGMALFQAEVQAIEKKLSLSPIAKTEEDYKLEEASAMIEDLKSKAVAEMDMAKRRDNIEWINTDPTTLKA